MSQGQVRATATARSAWSKRWFHPLGGAPYDFVMKQPTLARAFGRLLWNWDVRLLEADVRRGTRETPPGGRVLDVPCGGGITFPALAGGDCELVAADISPGMLARARREAAKRGLSVELLQGDVMRLPIDPGTVDLVLCFNGLDCFPDPRGAARSLASYLRPGGLLVGDMVVKGAGRRHDRLIALYQRRGIFGPGGTTEELSGWLEDAGFARIELERSGAVTHFRARRGG